MLFEDDPDDVFILEEVLVSAGMEDADLIHFETLTSGIDYMTNSEVDIVLLDLNLPDSRGTDTFNSLYTQFSDTPIIVLTGLDVEGLAMTALKSGAQDYLVKSDLQPDLLKKSILFALGRHRTTREGNLAQFTQDIEKLTSLDLFTLSAHSGVTAKSFGIFSLKDTAPGFYDSLVNRFSRIMEVTLEKRILNFEHDTEEELRRLADLLGQVKAGPRDVIDIYVQAMKNLSKGIPSLKVAAYTEEGRFTVLTLMGHLVTFYRSYYTNGSNAFTPPGQ